MTITRLNVRFDGDFAETGAALVSWEVFAEDRQLIHRGTIQLGGNATFDVPPGQYLVRAMLPGGAITQAGADTRLEPESVTIVLRPPRRSPRERLAWAYVLKGNAPRAGRQGSATRDKGIRKFGGNRDLLSPSTSLLTFESNGWVRRRLSTSSALQDYQAVDPLVIGAFELELSRAMHWLWVQTKFPWVWRAVALPPNAPGRRVRVLIRQEGDPLDEKSTYHPLRVIVDSGHPESESLLAYLTEGEFAAARAIGDSLMIDADDMLAEKREDPASAAIAGYFLLRAGNTRRLDWARNLDRWMEWLPDGAVIHAWYLLQRGEGDRGQIRERLLTAVSRGSPVYTQGLKLLNDGLAILDSQEKGSDRAIRDALSVVRGFLQLAEDGSPTTTLPAEVMDSTELVERPYPLPWPWPWSPF